MKLTGFSKIDSKYKGEIVEFSAHKPNFEVGASSQLSFGKTAVWSLSDSLVDDQVELINEDDLLDDNDLLKPTSESLKGWFNIIYIYCIVFNSTKFGYC